MVLRFSYIANIDFRFIYLFNKRERCLTQYYYGFCFIFLTIKKFF
ncbi:hypothetical protein FUAX_53070 (plasmid) [Fulvitalea axinellae]|uniref:Uncharacterized protein n=1 Tax=Fulvitalea axinellae TaxID=1182444 RepID=A0AAU9CUZ1_9BACT|nr:hypothetical protein FUAX_53070 [Fulvitalea axinellae]